MVKASAHRRNLLAYACLLGWKDNRRLIGFVGFSTAHGRLNLVVFLNKVQRGMAILRLRVARVKCVSVPAVLTVELVRSALVAARCLDFAVLKGQAF